MANTANGPKKMGNHAFFEGTIITSQFTSSGPILLAVKLKTIQNRKYLEKCHKIQKHLPAVTVEICHKQSTN